MPEQKGETPASLLLMKPLSNVNLLNFNDSTLVTDSSFIMVESKSLLRSKKIISIAPEIHIPKF